MRNVTGKKPIPHVFKIINRLTHIIKSVLSMKMHEILQKDPAIWALFTRMEEYQSTIRDKYDRFSYYASNDRDIFEPKASEYLVKNGFSLEYPENKPFAVCLSHDIDELYKTNGTKVFEALVQLRDSRLSAGKESLAQIRSKKIPFWNFSDIAALEDKYGAKSSFYFMVENPGDRDYNYDIEDCETIIGELSDGGWDIGLHGGHTTYHDPDAMKEKKKRLENVLKNKVAGYRNHYLRFTVPGSWEFLSQAGFLYDSTLGYHDCAGFRNGMCHPFRPFNRSTGKGIDIVEVPLTIMDTTLTNHMNLDPSTSWDLAKRLIDTVASCHGTISILWHNYSFSGDQRRLYEKILKYCAEKDAWMTSAREIARLIGPAA
jgi:peptidoglycan/xylan/chitin deacetylase (PgdA/CDA1 family)